MGEGSTARRPGTVPEWRIVLGVALPVLALVVGARALHPAGAGFLGIPVFLGTVLVAFLGLAFTKRGLPRLRGTGLTLALVVLGGAAASGIYWQRVWSYRHYEMEGIPLVLFYVLGFWWPGVFVATASRFLERGFAILPLGTYLGRLAVGVAAGALGAGIYEVAEERYYETRDRVPFAEAAGPLAPPWRGVEPGSFEVVHEDPELAIRARVDPSAIQSSYEFLRSVEDYLTHVRGLLSRKDTDRVTVEVDTPSGRLLAFRAADADSMRPLHELYSLERALLPNGGRASADDLRRMTWVPSDEFGAGRQDVFDRVFDAAIAVDTLSLTFRPGGPPDAATLDLYAAAWSTANRTVGETVHFFPGIRAFRIDFPGLDTVVERERAAKAAFRLQHLVRSPERILGLVVIREGRGEESLDPARFYPGREPIASAQVAVVRVSEPLVEHVAGLLFEGMLIGTGRLYLAELRDDGTALVAYAPWQGRSHGPQRLPVGEEVWLGPERVRNLGWFPRASFPEQGAP